MRPPLAHPNVANPWNFNGAIPPVCLVQYTTEVGDLLFQISLARSLDELARIRDVAPAADFGGLAFQFFVDGEEVFELPQGVRENIGHGLDLIESRIAVGHCQDFLICLSLVYHLQQADGPHSDQDTGITGLIDQREDIERIAIARQSAGDEAVIAGVDHGRIEGAIEAENAEVRIVLVLIPGIARDLHNHVDDGGAVGAGIEIVQRTHPAFPTV